MGRFQLTLRNGGGALLASLAVAALAAVANAGQITLEASDYWSHGGNGGWSATSYGGGEFRVQSYTGPNIAALGAGVQIGLAQGSPFTGVFETFCDEFSEEYYPGGTYLFDINLGAVNGGLGGQEPVGSSYDPLDARSAYLFTQFWTGQLSHYHYAVSVSDRGRADSATALQLALWAIENELSASLLNYFNTSTDAVAVQGRAWVTEAINANWTDVGNVRVMNLYQLDGNGNRIVAQDQLVLLEEEPTTIESVPLPSAGLMGLTMMSGLGVAGAWRRRRKQGL